MAKIGHCFSVFIGLAFAIANGFAEPQAHSLQAWQGEFDGDVLKNYSQATKSLSPKSANSKFKLRNWRKGREISLGKAIFSGFLSFLNTPCVVGQNLFGFQNENPHAEFFSYFPADGFKADSFCKIASKCRPIRAPSLLAHNCIS